jgi:hypothetical protein
MQISGSGNSTMMQQLQAMRTQMFQKADGDKSGGLSVDEFKVAGQNVPGGAQGTKGAPKAEEAFAKLDTNRDGNLTSDEMQAMKPPFDPASMSALLGAQESSQTKDSDPASQLFDVLNAQSDSATSSSSDDLVSQLMTMLNASDEKSAKNGGSKTQSNDASVQGSLNSFLNKAYGALNGARQPTLNLAA